MMPDYGDEAVRQAMPTLADLTLMRTAKRGRHASSAGEVMAAGSLRFTLHTWAGEPSRICARPDRHGEHAAPAGTSPRETDTGTWSWPWSPGTFKDCSQPRSWLRLDEERKRLERRNCP